MQVSLQLPYPPSVNHYWRRHGNRYFIAEAGVDFRRHVRLSALMRNPKAKPLEGPLSMVVRLFPKDRRVRDIDNGIKSLLDALAHAKVYVNDSQVKLLTISMGDTVKGGMCIAEVGPLP